MDRHGLSALAMTTHSLSLRGGSEARDAAILRVSGDAGGLSVRVARASGSPRAFSPRDDKGEGVSGGKIKNEIFYSFRVRFCTFL